MKWHHIGLFIALALVACNPAAVVGGNPPGGAGGGGGTGGSPPPAGLTGPVLAALYDGSTVRLWDGTNAVTWKTGAAVHGNGRKIAVGRTLYFLDSTGAVTSSMNLPASPAGVAVVGDPVVYTFESLSGQQSYDIDYTPGPHTRIWNGAAEVGDWHSNGWVYASSFEAENGDLVCLDVSGGFHDVTNAALTPAQIVSAAPGGPVFFQPDQTRPNELDVYDATGVHRWTFPLSSMWAEGAEWVKVGSTWYGRHGDTFSDATGPGGSTLGTVTGGGYGQPATMKAVSAQGTHALFVECNTGRLIDLDTVAGSWTAAALWAGDGTQTSGLAAAAQLTPALINGNLYYHQAGNLWQMDTASTVISSFSADQQMWVMK